MQLWWVAACTLLVGCRGSKVNTHWYRGNLHAHSIWSDGHMLPEEVAAWYAGHGYQFLGLADHNTLLKGEYWVTASEIRRRAGDDIATRLRERFGSEHLVSRQWNGAEEWRLQTMQELRRQFERPGQFTLLSNEEVTNDASSVRVHLTAVNISQPIDSTTGANAADIIDQTLARIDAQARAQGYSAIGVVNHPNFAWAVGADMLARVRAAQFVEIFNGHPFAASRGDLGKRPVTRLWDMCNAERVLERGWPPLFGVAGDDTHTREGADEPSPGRGWIMVRAASLRAEDLITAMRQGDFYASTGVRLNRLNYDSGHRVLSLSIEREPNTTYATEFIATKSIACPSKSASPADRWDSLHVGMVVARSAATASSYTLSADDVLIRATVTASRPPDNPMKSNYQGDETQFKQAFTQPVGWVDYLSRLPNGSRVVLKRCP
jgi:hypothetical protein